jgi:hypothetical protein
MNESDLRAAFAARLESVAPEREARLRAFDYRSRNARRHRLWALIGASSSALTAAIVAVIVLLSSGAPVAYAGWTPVPTTPTPAALAAATAACNWMNDANGPPTLTGTPVLIDARGRYTAAIYVNGEVAHICISDGEHNGTTLAMDSGVQWSDAAHGPDQLSSPMGSGGSAVGFPGSVGGAAQFPGSAEPGQEYNASGLAGSGVSDVAFVFADGATVDATVQNGWYFAWWPNRNWPTSVKVTSSSGTVVSPMSGGTAFGGGGSTPSVDVTTSMHIERYAAETAASNGRTTLILTDGQAVTVSATVAAVLNADREKKGLPPIPAVSAAQAKTLEQR